MTEKFTNNLIRETSPYLQQHAHNPVDWYPWCEEALQKAKAEDQPILLSIGYSACHWCHVMEHESFEDDIIAQIMNENFVCIKVDREERPDLDHIYQTVVQMLTGQGGWPLTVFLTPDQEPFWGGTYFPPDDRYGRPGFPKVLLALAEHYHQEKSKVASVTKEIKEALLRVSGAKEPDQGELSIAVLDHAAQKLSSSYDPHNGGFGSQPKFPNTKNLELFLRQYARTGEPDSLNKVEHTLRKMAEGGLYDQLDGGFHRYSVDAQWLVPHFEKMLYDNAFLAKILLETFQATRDPFFERIARETLDYVAREMTHPEGGFYGTQDADSPERPGEKGEEGAFFVWTPGEIFEVLEDRAAAIVCDYFGVTGRGNFEHGKSVLHINRPMRDIAFERNLTEEAVQSLVEQSRRKLLEYREKRIKPLRDEKILTDWNGMMISSFALAAVVLGDDRYRTIARRATEFILRHLFREKGQNGRPHLLHVFTDGQSKLNGYLDDYAYLAQGLLDLYEATFERKYLDLSIALTDAMLAEFWDEKEGGFFFTPSHHEALIHRPKQPYDHSIPSGQSVAVFNLVRLFRVTENEDYRNKAETVFRMFAEAMEQNPFGFTNLLCALDFHLAPPKEIVLVGGGLPGGPDWHPVAEEIVREVYQEYSPNKIVVGMLSAEGQTLPLLQNKTTRNGKPTVYVCQDFTCSAPLTEVEEVRQALGTRRL